MVNKKRKAQEEMVGFVLIIVLVAVIALVFLAISVRKPVEIQESADIENFLQASLLFTTSCQASPEITYDLKDLIKACYKNERCLDGEEACNALNKTSFGLVEAGFDISEEAKYKGYIFKIYDEGNNIIVYLTKGNQTATKTEGETYIRAEGQKLYARMQLFS